MNTEQVRAAIVAHLGKTVASLHRDGFVIGLSGGIDSSVTAHLAVEAVGPQRVLGVIMPERESSPESRELGLAVAEQLGIDHREVDLTPQLEAMGAYAKRDEIEAQYFPDYRPAYHRVGIALRQNLAGSSMPPLHYLFAQDDKQETVYEGRLKRRDYTKLVAATNFKQRARALQLYYHADYCNYAVLGTTNRDELLLGFFVKLGDGAADVEAIEGLYKSEVFELARALGVDQRIINRTPTTDTLPGQTSQRGYFYGLEFPVLDAALAVFEHRLSEEDAVRRTGLEGEQVRQIVANLGRRHDTTTILRSAPVGIGRAGLDGHVQGPV